MSMSYNQVRTYWNERAKNDDSAQSTTQDYYLRSIELRVLSEFFSCLRPLSIIDIGCGDARTTCALAQQFSETKFWGVDYSEGMIKNSKQVISSASVNNVQAVVADITSQLDLPPMEAAYTTRCLINITDSKLQKTAIDNIHSLICSGGTYVMIENFIEGHREFNRVREKFGLPLIEIRKHNLFFEHDQLMQHIAGKFEVVDEVNISSSYYLSSRIIYSKICLDLGRIPDYFDLHHKYGAELPFSGEYGPVRMITMKKV